MGLKYRIRTRDEAPEEQRGLYAEREGGWVLDVEGAVDKAKIDEFRTTNVTLLKERMNSNNASRASIPTRGGRCGRPP